MECVNRGALDCFTVVVCPNRTAFSCPHVGAYCIRPTGDLFMGRMIQMIDRRCAFLSPAGLLGGAYAIRPYPDGRKMIAVGVCFEEEYEKQAAFWGCYGVGGGKYGAFTCPCVGRKIIRPPNVPPKEGESPAIGRGQAFVIHGMAFCGAYAIRPYRDGRKMIAFGACSAVLPEKIGCLWGRLWGGRWKTWCV